MKPLHLLLAAAFAVLPAALPAQASHDPAIVEAGTFHTDPNHTLVTFDVSHFGFTHFYGTFPAATGTLVLDPKAPARSKLDIAVPIVRVSTTNATLDGELRGAEWFDVDRFPAARFVSTRVVPTGRGSARIEGTLTMHGVSKPLVLDAAFEGAGINPLSKAYTVGFKATGHVKRSDFGVVKYVPLVGDDVTLTIAGAFEKAK